MRLLPFSVWTHHGIPGQDPRQALTEQQRPDKLQVYKPS